VRPVVSVAVAAAVVSTAAAEDQRPGSALCGLACGDGRR
jgi:hypothetical protein